MARNQRRTDAVVVIGLGRFGESVALELMEQHIDVLGIDGDIRLVDALSGRLTQVVCADSTNEEALRQLSVHEFDRAVIAIGSNIESSILTTSVVLGFGVPHVWAKAISHAHARILDQIGAHHVVRPEHDMGKRVAHLVGGRMLEYIEFEDGFAMAKTNPPSRLLGNPLGRTGVRSEHGVTVVAIKRPGQDFTYATAETVIEPGDTIIVSGATTEVEKFSELT
jgi:trk system potassium uptake protein TrkA